MDAASVDAQRSFQPIKPHRRHGPPVLTAQNLTGAQLTVENLSAKGGHWSIKIDRQHPGLDRAAPLHARGGFLSDETALLKVDAVEQIEIGFDGIGRVRRCVGLRIWHAEGEAVRMIGGLRDFAGHFRWWGIVTSQAKRGEAWVADEPFGTVDLPKGADAKWSGTNRNLGAQPVQGQALDEGVAMDGGNIKPAPRFPRQNEQVVEQPPLRRQKPPKAKGAHSLDFHILREQALQKGAPIWAFYSDHGARGEGGEVG